MLLGILIFIASFKPDLYSYKLMNYLILIFWFPIGSIISYFYGIFNHFIDIFKSKSIDSLLYNIAYFLVFIFRYPLSLPFSLFYILNETRKEKK